MLTIILSCSLPAYDTAEDIPDYDVNCKNVTCTNADRIIRNTEDEEISCIWECVTYEEKTSVQLTLYFDKIDSCYEITSTIVQDGLCATYW